MDNELSEIYAFMQGIAPFEHADTSLVHRIVNQIAICYLPQGKQLPPDQFTKPHCFIVRKGALRYTNIEQELLGKFGEGDICTVFFQADEYQNIQVFTDEDCLLYCLEKEALMACLVNEPDILQFFTKPAAKRLSHTVDKLKEEAIVNSSLENTQIDQLYHSPIATIHQDADIQTAAIKMTDLGYSSLVITDDNQQVAGIVTDKDFRRRFATQSLNGSDNIATIMSKDIVTLDVNHSAFDALLTMNQHHIHHLPITQQGKLKGMLTITDLMHFEGQNAINLTSLIHKAQSIEKLKQISQLFTKLQIKMSTLGTTAEQVGKTISLLTMSLTVRLIELAEQELGKAPAPYAWLAAGSQARREQLAQSDQDNAIIIDDRVTSEQLPWFAQLAKFVSDGLAQCNICYCPGNVMATNSDWCQTEAVWHQYFQQWVEQPSPQALLHSTIFFDLTTVYGDASLLSRVKEKLLKRTKGASLFIAHLSKNALQHKPPLGFFRDFVLIPNGEHKKKMDIKHYGIAPIVDLARIYALSEGIEAVNTVERLQLCSGTKSLSKSAAASLIDAYSFLCSLRLSHQAKQLKRGEQADHYISPKMLSRLEREHLKDAFKMIKNLQETRQAIYS